ncbi:hypothetical protein QFZ35_003135 [Arthrobacter ulcerisalmonis]|nr:hypothetical protein [Arthrobacter ulcerisalmonis]
MGDGCPSATASARPMPSMKAPAGSNVTGLPTSKSGGTAKDLATYVELAVRERGGSETSDVSSVSIMGTELANQCVSGDRSGVGLFVLIWQGSCLLVHERKTYPYVNPRESTAKWVVDGGSLVDEENRGYSSPRLFIEIATVLPGRFLAALPPVVVIGAASSPQPVAPGWPRHRWCLLASGPAAGRRPWSRRGCAPRPRAAGTGCRRHHPEMSRLNPGLRARS